MSGVPGPAQARSEWILAGGWLAFVALVVFLTQRHFAQTSSLCEQ